MKKKLFRIMALVGLAAMMTVGFAGCKKTECEWCHKEDRCKKVDLSLIGERSLCKECRETAEMISEQLKPLDEMENGK